MNDARAALANRPSNSTLAELPARVLTFLIAVATRAPIRALMYEGGYRIEDHAEGWRLLTAAGEIRERAPVGAARCRAQSALEELHVWVTANFRRFRAAMERLHPEWIGLFPEVDSRYSADALLAMARLVERIRRGDASRDASLLATLGQRGLDRAEIERLERLVTDAQRVDDGTNGDEPDVDVRTEELVALYRWYSDWVESAKRFVKRKDYRYALGIGGKREG